MNREQAKQLLPIIQAFADGAEVQFQTTHGDWQDAGAPCFSPLDTYRIKPKPLEGWGTVWHDGDLSTLNFHVSEAEARQRVILSEDNRRAFRWVEVI